MTVVVRWTEVGDVDIDRHRDAVPAGQLSRLRAFRGVDDQRRFVGVRVLLRAALAEVVGCDPVDVELTQWCSHCAGPHGRPVVTIAGAPGPHVSMAHAGGIAVVAVARRPVGVDLEPVATDGIDRVRWVRTEAVLKATGHGLDVDPSLIDVTDDSPPRLGGWNGPGRRPVVRLSDVVLDTGFVAALALLGRRPLRIDVRSVDLASLAD